jgi:hypothetical protein
LDIDSEEHFTVDHTTSGPIRIRALSSLLVTVHKKVLRSCRLTSLLTLSPPPENCEIQRSPKMKQTPRLWSGHFLRERRLYGYKLNQIYERKIASKFLLQKQEFDIK